MKKITTIPEGKAITEKDVAAELRKYVTPTDIVNFRLAVESAKEGKPSYANITDMPFVKSCDDILVTDEDIARLGDNTYISGVVRAVKKLRISGNLKTLVDVVTRMAYAKISDVSNAAFIAMTAAKVMEVSRLYSFS